MKQPLWAITTLITLCLLFSLNIGKSNAQVTDFDGKVYKTIKIGTQIWMAEDLEVKHYNNGEPIPVIDCPRELDNQKSEAWNGTRSGAMCIGKKPGRDVYVKGGRSTCTLYNWYALDDSRGLAPKGWHVPTKQEWLTLIDYLGGLEIAGNMMKSLNGWDTKYASNGNNISGFSALPTGQRSEVGFYMGFSQYAWYWTATSEGAYYAHTLQLGWQTRNNSALMFGTDYRQSGLAIRCVKD